MRIEPEVGVQRGAKAGGRGDDGVTRWLAAAGMTGSWRRSFEIRARKSPSSVWMTRTTKAS